MMVFLWFVPTWTKIINKGEEAQGLEYVSSFSLNGIDKEGIEAFDEKIEIAIPHNAWQKELCWQTYTLKELETICFSARYYASFIKNHWNQQYRKLVD